MLPAAGFCQDLPVKARALSLDEAISTAFDHNSDIRVQEEEIKVASSAVLAAKGNFLPRVNAAASYDHNQSVLSVPAIPGAKKDPGIFSGYRQDNRLGVVLSAPVYSGGANTAGLRQAQTRTAIERQTLRAQKSAVKLETKRLYYGLLLAAQTRRIAAKLVGLAKAHYASARKRYQQGTVSRFDVLQSKVQVAKLIPEMVRADNALELTRAELKKLLGLDLDDDIILTDKLEVFLIKIDEKAFLKRAYLNNPRMSLRSLGVDLGQWSIALADSLDKPRLDLGADYSVRSNNTGNIFDRRHNNWSAGVTVSVPIFDAFSSRSRVQEAKSRYRQAVIEKEDLSRQIAFQVKQACLDLKRAQAVMASQKSSLDEAREALRIADIGYASGVNTNLDVMDSQVSLSQIEKNMYESMYDYLMAQAFLDDVMGNGGNDET